MMQNAMRDHYEGTALDITKILAPVLTIRLIAFLR